MTFKCSEKVLKGGSLNKTVLMTFDGSPSIVRKSISLAENREYGFVRWHSQFKRIQKYNILFPGLFPKLLDVGVVTDYAYFDIEYIENGLDAKAYLSRDHCSIIEINQFHNSLWNALSRLHSLQDFQTFKGSLDLYFKEEVYRRLEDALLCKDFSDFCANKKVVIEGRECSSLVENLESLQKIFSSASIDRECFTHGNITLENIIYIPSSNRIVFIDPYEENVVDCREAEYSQILQCSSHAYGFINDGNVTIENNGAFFQGVVPLGFSMFDSMFKDRLDKSLSSNQLKLVNLFELSQFVRMLPFKILSGQIDKAKYFYALASRLSEEIVNL